MSIWPPCPGKSRLEQSRAPRLVKREDVIRKARPRHDQPEVIGLLGLGKEQLTEYLQAQLGDSCAKE